MKVHYLGTAASEGWPAPFCRCNKCETARKLKGKNLRSRAQVLVNEDLLMDFGPDTYYHSLQYGLNLDNVHTVLLTHSHTDHFQPLEINLRAEPYAFEQNSEKLHFYGNELCHEMFDQLLSHREAAERLSDYADYTTVKAGASFASHSYKILPLKAVHDPGENCLLYAVTAPDGKTLFYGNDTGSICQETWDAVRDMHFDLVSLDCTMGTGAPCDAHLNLEGDSKIRKQMLEIGCADENTVFVVTHFSHGMCPLHDELAALASKEGFLTAYDGMIIEIT